MGEASDYEKWKEEEKWLNQLEDENYDPRTLEEIIEPLLTELEK